MMQQQDNEPTIIERSKAWLLTTLHRGRAGAAWLWRKMKPARSTAKPKAQPQKRQEQRTWIDQAIDGAFLLVTSLAFLVFLMASLPHVAYFVVTFEPQNPDGSISDWWWMVAYLIAGAINITEFLLSVKFARDVRNATRGLPWYQKVIPTLATGLKYWPFILLISGFSWAANLEHAEQFHSTMLSTAESVNVIVPFFQNKTWGDLNPYIVSAYPLLNIAYTFMFDASRSSEQAQSEQDEQSVESRGVQSTNNQPQSEQPISFQEMFVLIREMHEQQQASLNQLTAAITNTVLTSGTNANPRQIASSVKTQTRTASGNNAEGEARTNAKDEQTKEQVKRLILDDPEMAARAIARTLGMAPSTAHKWKDRVVRELKAEGLLARTVESSEHAPS